MKIISNCWLVLTVSLLALGYLNCLYNVSVALVRVPPYVELKHSHGLYLENECMPSYYLLYSLSVLKAWKFWKSWKIMKNPEFLTPYMNRSWCRKHISRLGSWSLFTSGTLWAVLYMLKVKTSQQMHFLE